MTDIIIITPDTNKKEIGCNFKNCSRISFCIMQRSRPQKFSFGSASFIKPSAETNAVRAMSALADRTFGT